MCALAAKAGAWGYDGHRMVTELALKSLPEDFPAWVQQQPENAERVRFLANVPDRWRNVDPYLNQSGGSWCDHFLDLEQLSWAGLDAKTVSSFRYDFIAAFAAGRAAHMDKFSPIDPTKNADHTKEWPGFAPWAIVEYYAKLKAAFSYLKTYQESGGTPEEIANAKADALYAMGILAHYTGDCAQPLHTTVHHDGWVGANPNGYTKQRGFHTLIDSGLITRVGIKADDIAGQVTPAQPIAVTPRADGREPIFAAAMDYVLASNEQVEPLYALEKAGKFNMNETTLPSTEAQDFIKGRLLVGGEMLGSLWLTAWRQAGPDTYLRGVLVERGAVAAKNSSSSRPSWPPPPREPANAEKK